jgi:hypothetical protein
MTSTNLANLVKIGQLEAIARLAHTLGVDGATIRVLDSLRKQRNLSDYDGELVSEAALQECLKQAQALLTRVESVLSSDAD